MDLPLPLLVISRTLINMIDEILTPPNPEHVAEIRKWKEAVIRFHLVTNAGGALATLSFIGATWVSNAPFKPALFPLSCFILGIIFAGFSVQGELMDSFKHATRGRAGVTIPNWIIPAIVKGGTLGAYASIIANGLFVIGAIIGILLLWAA